MERVRECDKGDGWRSAINHVERKANEIVDWINEHEGVYDEIKNGLERINHYMATHQHIEPSGKSDIIEIDIEHFGEIKQIK